MSSTATNNTQPKRAFLAISRPLGMVNVNGLAMVPREPQSSDLPIPFAAILIPRKSIYAAVKHDFIETAAKNLATIFRTVRRFELPLTRNQVAICGEELDLIRSITGKMAELYADGYSILEYNTAMDVLRTRAAIHGIELPEPRISPHEDIEAHLDERIRFDGYRVEEQYIVDNQVFRF